MRSLFRVVATCLVCLPFLAEHSPGAAQEQVSAPPQVNIEIVLDSSGSMASLTDSGETRMDAAKRVLTEVVNSIPSREGQVNVGFRIYGHKGDNTDATKDLSCNASDLLAPVKGVDQNALIAAISSAQPTGWTPIARSLSRAGKDFPEASESVINTVVLVTDGVETCDGNPVKVAKDLHKKKSVQMVTHVIGFGTTPEDQQVLGAIAEQGGGQLFGASNAQQLRASLFDVLEQLQIVVGVGYVGGNAFGVLPHGEPGVFSVIGTSWAPLLGSLSFTLINNTGVDVADLSVNVTIRDGVGNLVGAGSAMRVSPFFLRSGGVAFGDIHLGSDTLIPSDAQYEWKIVPGPEQNLAYSNTSDLDIVEASLFENRIAGTVKNGFDEISKGPFSFNAVCFDQAGTMTGTANGYLDLPQLAPDEEQSFQVDLFLVTYQGAACPAFLVSGQGHGPSRIPAKLSTVQTGRESEPTSEPVESPTSVPASSADGSSLPGVEDGALRNFSSGDGVTEGLLSLGTVVFSFATEDLASTALTLVIDGYFQSHDIDPATAQASSAPKVGDERKALTFTLDENGIPFQIGILAVRDGSNVFFLLAICRNSNPIQEIAPVSEAIFAAGRSPGTGDGLYSLLPTLDEVPLGMYIELETIPENWGPISSA